MTVEATARGGSERVALWANRIEGPPAGCAVLVAHNNDGLQGFVYVGPTGDTDDSSGRTGQVFSIHVDPQAWGAGVGSELLDEAVSFLRATGFDDATLWVVEGNHRARQFYEARGWQVDGARRHEVLVIGGGEGDQVEVVRYRRQVTVGENR